MRKKPSGQLRPRSSPTIGAPPGKIRRPGPNGLAAASPPVVAPLLGLRPKAPGPLACAPRGSGHPAPKPPSRTVASSNQVTLAIQSQALSLANIQGKFKVNSDARLQKFGPLFSPHSASRGQQTLLEKIVVLPAGRANYLDSLKILEAWRKEEGLAAPVTPEAVLLILLDFLDILFLEGGDNSHGTKI